MISKIRIVRHEEEANKIIQEEEAKGYVLKDVKTGLDCYESSSVGFSCMLVLVFVEQDLPIRRLRVAASDMKDYR